MGKQEKYKAKEDNRDIFDKALDGFEVFAPAAGAAAGGVLGRRLSRSMHNMRSKQARRDLEMLEKTPPYKFQYGSRQRDAEIGDTRSFLQRGYRPSGATTGAAAGVIVGYGSSEISSSTRKRRK